MADNLLDQLEQEHDEVQDILNRLADTQPTEANRDIDVSKREDLFHQLKRALVPHMKGEERFFYPALKESRREIKMDALKAVDEHHAGKLLLNELDEMDKDSDEWGAKLSVLRELLNRHIEKEEDVIFDDAGDVLSDERMDQILELYRKEKEKVLVAV